MKTGIIGLPQVGKTSLFKILTKARLDAHAMHSRDAHVGVARVPDERLDRLSALYHPKKTTHATVEYVEPTWGQSFKIVFRAAINRDSQITPYRKTDPSLSPDPALLLPGQNGCTSSSADSVLDAAPKLPEKERARVAAELVASLDGEPEDGVEAAWASEVERRIAEVPGSRFETR